MTLPSSCEGCPFYKYADNEHNGFVPDTVIPGSKVYFLAQNPGRDEIVGKKLVKRHFYGGGNYSDEYVQVAPQPLIGATGQQFNNRFLPLSGLKRDEISVGNAIRCRPGKALGLKADDLPNITATMKLESSKADIVNALKHCRETHFHPPQSVQYVVAMGRYAMFIMTGLSKDEDEYKKKQSVLESWRGYGVDADFNRVKTVDSTYYHSLQSNHVVFFTMHIAALNYGNNKRFIHATLQDFYKLKLLINGEWPKQLPTWYTQIPDIWPMYSAFDTEYNPNTAELYRWSMCSSEYELYCIEAFQSSIVPVQPGSTVLIQNVLADKPYLPNVFTVNIKEIKLEDLMLAHSVLWTGEPHSLNYINSIYGAFNRYKHLNSDNPQLYSALDSYEPMYMWRTYFIPEFKRDRQSWLVYKKYRLPLIDIIEKAQLSGVKVDTHKLSDVKGILTERIQEYKKKAVEITGNDSFKLGSTKDMKGVMYG